MSLLRKLQFKFVQSILEINERLFFQKKIRRLVKSILPENVEVIFDIGANRGQSIFLFKKWFPKAKLYSFEPNPKLFLQLKKKYKKNSKIQLYELALSDENGTKIFNENLFHSSSTLENVNPDSVYLKKKAKLLGVSPEKLILKSYPVKIKPLSMVIDELKLNKVDFIKIDVEGHELKCLDGLFRNLKAEVKCIQVEINSNDLYGKKKGSNEIFDLMNKNGFKNYKIIKHGFGNFSDVVFWKSFSL
tara:strand:- start:995 stop:1732 length:738 start_codon:yes stop_codon:yes gene_type:complete